ncbi:hypothetical protein Hbut_1563 [Hyperthermus butylicus DSM 5456]|uniref:TFIIB-type domain-containing protein n=1 Tax=Hyperthermus butylicus (strain DSM 5456 / JCM 9403 / PLM1-5) TaxID=415426 RepID=A2BN23_HYPBU|nr:hypothetical protein Hbut_1563 [Hyperthermus butylicus DSM 5456]
MVLYYPLIRLEKCPYCGSSKLIVESARGQLVCAACGAVLDDLIVSYESPGPPLIVSHAGSLPVEKRYTITEANVVRYEFAGLKLYEKLAKLLGSRSVERVREAAAGDRHALSVIASNKCLEDVMRSLPEPERGVVVELALSFMRGEYPLLSIVAERYGVSRARVRSLARRVRKCMGQPSLSEALASMSIAASLTG